MLRMITEWFRRLWRDPIDDFIGDAYWNEYEDAYLKNKYGIPHPFAVEDEEKK